MDTYTLIAIHRINGTRTRKVQVKPKSGLTMDDLNKIRQREVEKLWKKYPDMPDSVKIMNLDVNLEYRTDEKGG